ncbi:MAG: alanyl-tRNA editing protein [Proteobacteria bacterium]|nr:alanyl-tRNA editing protein [Pseudomonadota bacterium]
MATEKIFLSDMYASKAEATILEIEENRVLLDRTVFYAESGGQLGDTGYIGDQRVIDTQKKITESTRMLAHPDFPSINVNMDIVHFLEEPPKNLRLGDKVKTGIDWQRRFAIMRLHSAAHIVWHFVEQQLGSLPLKGCLIGPEKSRLDFGAKIDPEAIPDLVRASNEFSAKEYSIQNVPLDHETEALFWICNQVKIPCGGTHVKNTKEIGPITLKRRSQGKKLDRLYISLEDSSNP